MFHARVAMLSYSTPPTTEVQRADGPEQRPGGHDGLAGRWESRQKGHVIVGDDKKRRPQLVYLQKGKADDR